MAIRGVFFDLYGTLLVYGDMARAWDAWFSAFDSCMERHGFRMPWNTMECTNAAIFDRPMPATEAGLTRYECRIKAACAEAGVPVTEACAHALASDSATAWGEYVTLDPEAVPLLGELRPRVKLALVSNYDHPPHLRRILAHCGIDVWFDPIVISGEIGVEKPDPAIFHFCMQQLCLSPHEVVHVGDSVEDIEGALAAGCHAVHIARPGVKPLQIAIPVTITALAELPLVLDSL